MGKMGHHLQTKLIQSQTDNTKQQSSSAKEHFFFMFSFHFFIFCIVLTFDIKKKK